MNSHRINRVWACLYTSTLCLPQGRCTHTNNCCGIGSVVNSQLLLITQHKLTQLPTRSRQLRCNTTQVCKLHQQTVGVHGAACRSRFGSSNGWFYLQQESRSEQSCSTFWQPYLKSHRWSVSGERKGFPPHKLEKHISKPRELLTLAYNLIINEEGREQMQLLRSFNVNKIKCF